MLLSTLIVVRPSGLQEISPRAPGPMQTRHAVTPPLRSQARLAFLKTARVWTPTHVSAMDVRAGPPAHVSWQPNEMVTCDYIEVVRTGSSRKFHCVLASGLVVKVRYGAGNGEVYGSVLATRLLWALGFGADRVDPVRVRCQGCSSDPWNDRKRAVGEQVFDPATIERKPAGHEMKTEPEGWAWPELRLVDGVPNGASDAERDALTLLAVFVQHTDSKRQQQRFLCLPGGMTEEGLCTLPFLFVHDVGLTFGRASLWNRASTGSVNFDAWSSTPIWRDAGRCVGHLSESKTGTLKDPTVSEAGRRFLADLLVQLTDRQLRDLFDVARVDRRGGDANGSRPRPSVDEWVAAFKHKRDEVVLNHCPA